MHAANREHPPARLRLTLAVSVGVHILLFGTALAFARYGEYVSPGGSRILMVALVSGSGSGGPGSDSVVRSRIAVRQAGRAVMPEETAGRGMAPDGKVAEAKAGEEAAALPVSAVSEGDGRDAAAPAVSYEGEPGGMHAWLGAGDSVPAGPAGAEQWRMLQTAIDKAKTYPRLARERGIEGTVLIRFKVLPSGAVESVNVVRSSGVQILDEASVRTVYRAAPMPYVDGWVEVPMVYELK